eukprot:3108112-Pyramimonas_sp.AAC.3
MLGVRWMPGPGHSPARARARGTLVERSDPCLRARRNPRPTRCGGMWRDRPYCRTSTRPVAWRRVASFQLCEATGAVAGRPLLSQSEARAGALT